MHIIGDSISQWFQILLKNQQENQLFFSQLLNLLIDCKFESWSLFYIGCVVFM